MRRTYKILSDYYKNVTVMKKKLQLFVILAFVCTLSSAQAPANYYNSAFGKKKEALKTALYNIIDNHTVRSYDYLWTAFQTTDRRADGKVWDMYSTCTWTFGNNRCGNYSTVCDCYNREHSIPESWFNRQQPMRSDAFHIYPTDGRVNGQRNNYPFGECANGTTLAGGLGKLGRSTFSGYSGTVFEPDDEYKGDFARTYFYFATRYESIMTSIDGESFNKTTYPSFSDWSQSLFLKWHRQDPVSPKEIYRNNAIYEFQDNRNPFIDYPELAEHIWGNLTTDAFNPNTNELEETKITPPTWYVEDGTLHINNSSEGAVIQLYNVYGQLITKIQSTSGTHNIPLEQERFYIMCINDNKGNSWTYKILNNK